MVRGSEHNSLEMLKHGTVVVEKPFTSSSEEADRLIAVSKQGKSLLTVYQSERILNQKWGILTFEKTDAGMGTFVHYVTLLKKTRWVLSLRPRYTMILKIRPGFDIFHKKNILQEAG
jgi:hypothetical protein